MHANNLTVLWMVLVPLLKSHLDLSDIWAANASTARCWCCDKLTPLLPLYQSPTTKAPLSGQEDNVGTAPIS
jgi:hypothetical protein